MTLIVNHRLRMAQRVVGVDVDMETLGLLAETLWDDDGHEEALPDAPQIWGWLTDSDHKTSTVHLEVSGEVQSYVVGRGMPLITSSAAQLKAVLRVTMCLQLTAEAPRVNVLYVATYVNKEVMAQSWSRIRAIPCFADIFRLCNFYHMFAPCGRGQGSASAPDCTPLQHWMQKQMESDSCATYTGTMQVDFIRVPGTTAVLDITNVDVMDNPDTSTPLPCPGGVLSGPTGAGKFTACIRHIVASSTTPCTSSPTHSRAAFIIVDAVAASWRLFQIQMHAPTLKLVVLFSNADCVQTTYRNILDADIVLVTKQQLQQNVYLGHLQGVANRLSLQPTIPDTSPPAPTLHAAKRRRVDDEDQPPLVPFDDAPFDPHMHDEKTSLLGLRQELQLACRVARQALQTMPLQWQDVTAPVLELLTYAQLVFVDVREDKRNTTVKRWALLESTARWATTSCTSVDGTDFRVVLPSVMNTTAAFIDPEQQLVMNFMTFTFPSARTKNDRTTMINTFVELTATETVLLAADGGFAGQLRAAKQLGASTPPPVVQFASKEDMLDVVLQASRQHLDTLRAKRDILQTDFDRAQAAPSLAPTTLTAVESSVVSTALILELLVADNDDNCSETIWLDIAGAVPDDDDDEDDEDYNDDDVEEEIDDDDYGDADDDDDSYYDDGGDDDNGGGDDDDDNDDVDIDIDIEDMRVFEARMLALSPEHMLATLSTATAEIDKYVKDEELLKSRIQDAISLMDLDTELCGVCSSGHMSAILACGHTFCVDCIVAWRKEKGSCPSCDRPVTTIIALDVCSVLPCPVASPSAEVECLWSRVWQAQSLSSALFWFLYTLQGVEARGERAVLLVNTPVHAAALTVALIGEGVHVLMFAEAQAGQAKALLAFHEKQSHVVIVKADVLAGAGFNNVTDVLLSDGATEGDDKVLQRFYDSCLFVHTYTRVRNM